MATVATSLFTAIPKIRLPPLRRSDGSRSLHQDQGDPSVPPDVTPGAPLDDPATWARTAKGRALDIGVSVDPATFGGLDLVQDGGLTEETDGSTVIRVMFISPGSVTLTLLFGDVSIPPGLELLIYTPDSLGEGGRRPEACDEPPTCQKIVSSTLRTTTTLASLPVPGGACVRHAAAAQEALP